MEAVSAVSAAFESLLEALAILPVFLVVVLLEVLDSARSAFVNFLGNQIEMFMGITSIENEAEEAWDCNNENMSLEDSLNQTEIITYMDRRLYKATVEGDIAALKRGNLYKQQTSLTPNKNSVLHIHIMAQSREMESTDFVEEILKMCPSLLLQENANGEIPLHIAARHRSSGIVRVLIKRVKALNQEDTERGDVVGEVRSMLTKENANGETPLHIAARYGSSGTVKVLIERAKALHQEDSERGDVVGEVRSMLTMTNKEKDTALHVAVRSNHLPVVKLLTREDPEFSYSANDDGETPLYMAVDRRFRDLAFEILRTCTSPAHGGPNGKTTLHAAVIHNDREMTRTIVELKGALTKERDQKGWTPLHYAAHLGRDTLVELLLNDDKSVGYYADRYGKRTALHIAAGRGHRDVMKELISYCPDCWEQVDKRGWNVLHFAVESRDKATVKFVLDNFWHSNLINEKSLSPLNIILANKKDYRWKGAIVRDLIKAGAREDGDRRNDKRNDARLAELKKAKEPNLIVAALIATVTFAAGFTMPGGYISDKGQDEGTPILIRKVAFKAFAITDTIAMVLSSSAVFIHLFLALPARRKKFVQYFVVAFWLTILAMGAMVVAFMTGMYAVLEHSSLGLAIAICVVASSFFLFFYYPFTVDADKLSKNKSRID